MNIKLADVFWILMNKVDEIIIYIDDNPQNPNPEYHIINKNTYYVATNKACTACDYYIFHYCMLVKCDKKLLLLLRKALQAVEH